MPNDKGFAPIDPLRFRRTMGRYPTGVVLISSKDSEGNPYGMIVGTFTSVSLEPPLVAFLPAKTSTTWPIIEANGTFAVSVLSADQENVVRSFSGKDAEKFQAVNWHESPSGNPVIDGSIAWMDCEITDVMDAGDHVIVLGGIHDMATAGEDLPLLFFQGGFGQFTPGSFAATGDEIQQQLSVVDRVRPHMEALAKKYQCGCLIGGKELENFVILASAGSEDVPWLPSVIGRRTPIAAPFGRTAIAFAEEQTVDAWIVAGVQQANADFIHQSLDAIRDRGYSMSVTDPDIEPDDASELTGTLDPGVEEVAADQDGKIHSLAVPIFSRASSLPMVLSLYGLDFDRAAPELESIAQDLKAIAADISDQLINSAEGR